LHFISEKERGLVFILVLDWPDAVIYSRFRIQFS